MKPIEKCNIFEFHEHIKNNIEERWKTDHQQYFIRCTTRDKDVYDNSLSGPYRFFIACINRVHQINYQHAGYWIEDADAYCGIDVIAQRKRLIDDIQKCADIRIWCIEVLGG